MAEDKKPAKVVIPIADVAHPDKTAAEPTAKSIIVNNRPIIKDPMMKEDEAANEATTEPLVTKPNDVKISVKPLEEDTEKPVETETKAPIPDTAKAEPEPEPVVEKSVVAKEAGEKPAAAEPEAKAQEDQREDEQPDEGMDKKQTDQDMAAVEEAEAAKLAEHDAAIQKLVEDKQYFLPINTVEKRKTRRFVLLGVVLSLLLALAWADIALDAGLIQISGIKPVTHFFSN